jgi:hypothetical protein
MALGHSASCHWDRFSAAKPRWRLKTSSINFMETLLVLILILALLGALPVYPYSSSWGYYPSGGLGLVLVIVILLVLFNYV